MKDSGMHREFGFQVDGKPDVNEPDLYSLKINMAMIHVTHNLKILVLCETEQWVALVRNWRYLTGGKLTQLTMRSEQQHETCSCATCSVMPS